MATKSSKLTANSRFSYQNKEFFPGDRVSITNREDALELLTIGFVVGIPPKETSETGKKLENTSNEGVKK